MKIKTSKKPPIRIAVLESDPLRFIGLRALLESEKDLELTAVPLSETGTLLDQDVVLVAERYGVNTVERIENLKAQQPGVRILVAGSDHDDEAVLRVVTGGAKGYVRETATAAEFSQAIRIVNQGLVWAPRSMFSLLIDRSASLAQRKVQSNALTNREKQVLQMLVAGQSNKEIGLPLGIEERTVKAHVAKLMRKLGVENRIKLSVHAVTHSLVPRASGDDRA